MCLPRSDEVIWKEDGAARDQDDEDDDEEDGWMEVDEEEEETSNSKKGRKSVSSSSKKQKASRDAPSEEEEEEEENEEEGDWESVSGSDGDEGEEEGVDTDSDVEEGDWEEVEEEAGGGDSDVDTGDVEVLSKSAQAKKMNNIRNRLDARRVLTDADFALIGKLKAAQAERLLDPRYRTKGALAHVAAKRKRQEEDDEEAAGGANEFTVDPDSLAAGMRTGKTSKIERIMNVLEGRKDVRFEHEGHAGGLTNKEKLRLKNYVMVRKGKRSVSGKINKSNGDVRYSKMKAVCHPFLPLDDLFTHSLFPPHRKSSSVEIRESAEEHKVLWFGEVHCVSEGCVLYFCDVTIPSFNFDLELRNFQREKNISKII